MTTQWQATNDARTLPTFAEIIDRTSGELAEALDTLRSDWRPDAGPTSEQADARHEALRLLRQAQAALERAAW